MIRILISDLLPGDMLIRSPFQAWMILSVIRQSHRSIKITWITMCGYPTQSPIFSMIYSNTEILDNSYYLTRP